MAGLTRHPSPSTKFRDDFLDQFTEVPKPGRNGKPRQKIMSFYTDFIAGLGMDHGTIGRQGQNHSFSNEKRRSYLGY
jgi:hypothetical protein